ncbi:hypothetical protein [Paenarthrobacter nitroguajacolicus]|uniref:hypothetical protein n=1 Tax=Paenarthrobacter nitroguajacolicus TaxID=211146 RepID=UPI00248C61AA|nr:hypothetical protein [Paenarthrobacter nitroguajacolicus]MDI2033594.1 hypothetical protein [Paenarthrobacter nitroguajacolicus]
MYKPQNIFAATQDLSQEWVNHAAEGTSSQTDAVVRWALARINHADVPSVVHGVILTLTGNQRTAKEARRSAEAAVKRATRALRRSSPKSGSGGAAWVALIAAAGLIAGAVLAWRMMVPSGEPSPVSHPENPDRPARTGEDGA